MTAPAPDDDPIAFPDLRPAPPPLDDAELVDGSRLSLGSRARIRATALATVAPYRVGWLASRLPRWIWYIFRDLLVGILRTVVYLYAWCHMADERRTIAQMDSRDAKARAKREINRDTRIRLIVAAVLAGTVALAHLALFILGSPALAGSELYLPGAHPALILEALALLGMFEWIGHRPIDKDDPSRRRGPLTHGTSARSLRRDLEEGFAARKLPDVGVIGLTVNKYGWHGTFETEAKLDDALVEHLERWVHAPAGSLLIKTDPRNAASRPFKLLIEDPLAQSSVPEVPEGPRDIRHRARIGRHLFGAPVLVNLRQHIGLIGRSGSGKSSGVWILIDWITSCANARVVGIDLTNGPALPTWRRAIDDRAFDPEGAARILDEAIALAQDRNGRMAALADTDDDGDLDENWVPTAKDPATYVVIDEFHVLADDKDLLKQVKLLARIGRKACVFLILATPGASREDMGSTIIKAMVGLKFLFSCIQQDVTNFLGGKMLDMGWRPDKLSPAAADQPRDAGKAYLWDGDHQDPEVIRVGRLTANQCRDRARGRARSPRVKVTPPEPSETPVVIPPALALLLAAFESYPDRDRLPTELVLSLDNDKWTKTSLASAAKKFEVEPRQLGPIPGYSTNVRGYLWADVERARDRACNE